jgi:hypothetical protein
VEHFLLHAGVCVEHFLLHTALVEQLRGYGLSVTTARSTMPGSRLARRRLDHHRPAGGLAS